MTYETVTIYSQTASLILFMTLFLGAAIYAFWPGNAATFERAARLPLKPDTDMTTPEGPDVR